MSVSTTLSDNEFITEVRTALGELDDDMISDATIMQQKDRFVIPYLEDKNVSGSGETIDTAMIALSAEKSFNAWMKKSQIAGGQMNVTFNTEEYADNLAEQSSSALKQLNINRAPGSSGAAFVSSSDGWL